MKNKNRIPDTERLQNGKKTGRKENYMKLKTSFPPPPPPE